MHSCPICEIDCDCEHLPCVHLCASVSEDFYRTCAIPKPRPRRLEKREKKAALLADDARERNACHKRSGGRCEVLIANFRPEASELTYTRCKRAVRQNHHLIGGRGRRNVGRSLFAAFRLDVCNECHADITDKILVPMRQDQAYEAATIRFERRTL